MRSLLVFSFTIVICSTQNFSIPGLPANLFNSPEAHAALCLIPSKFINFAKNLKANEIFALVMLKQKLEPELQAAAKSGQDPDPKTIAAKLKEIDSHLYNKIKRLGNYFKNRAKTLTATAKKFLKNLKKESNALKAQKDQLKTNYQPAKVFFQKLYTDYNNLDQASKNSIANYFPTLSHIIGCQAFMDYLKASAHANSFDELTQANKSFGNYVKEHACDKQNN